MRNFKATDLFALSRILKKMNIKDEIKGLDIDINAGTDKVDVKETVIIELIYIFLENIGLAEIEVYKFLADIEGRKVDDIKNLEIDEFIDILRDVFNNEGFTKLFTQALR